jgi:hypothetical protein
VVALLNDIFGIQARGGCSCAGPYGHELLDLSMSVSAAIESQLHEGNMVLRPGWTRLNFNYFIDELTFDYLLNALTLVAKHGWRLLASYQFNQQSSTWEYVGGRETSTFSLADLLDGKADAAAKVKTVDSQGLADYLVQGEQILLAGSANKKVQPLALSPAAEALRWFAVPQ